MSGPSVADCLFCRIVAGELDAEVVAQSELALAIRDIAPVGPSHVLVIPRAHLKDVNALNAEHGEILLEMLTLAQRVAASEGIAEDGYRLVFNVGEHGGNTVAHLHLHVIGGRQMSWPPG